MTPFDLDMMRIALRMAKRGLGQTAPNPAVGAVIADETTGEVIARGWTQPGGRPHAETEAIRRAGARARGKTLYVTLEPCAHYGKTPPCAGAIIEAGLARVVIGVGDPDPRTAGQGIARLRQAGLAVTEHGLEDEARRITLGHILRVTANRPVVTLKIATDAEGNIPSGDGTAPRWATGPQARAAGHLLRAEADAILIGRGTMTADDPDLTCRLPGLSHRSPLRVLLSGSRPLPKAAKLFTNASDVPVLVFASGDAEGIATPAGVTVCHVPESQVPGQNHRADLRAVVEKLAVEGVTRLLVEGGPSMWRAFAAAGFADCVALFIAGQGHGEDMARAILMRWTGTGSYNLIERRPVGADTLWSWAQAAPHETIAPLVRVRGHC